MVSISYAQDSQWATKRTKFSFLRALELHNMRMKSIQNQHEIPKPVKNKNREKHTSKKNNYTYKTVFTWFGNLPTSTELQGFHYYQGKNTKCSHIIFFSLKNYVKKP